MGIVERKEREKGARRDEIIAAAEKVFFEKGLSTSTMDDIAEKAELSKGTLYLYYKSKEDLVLTIAERGLDIMYGMFEKAVSTGEPPLKLISNIGEAYLQFFRTQRPYFRIMYSVEKPQENQMSTEIRERCLASDRKVWKLLIDLIQRAIDEGYLRKGLVPLEVGIMLWSNSNGLMRLMERDDNYWTEIMGVDVEKILRKSNAFLVEAMMTDEARRESSFFNAEPEKP